MQDFRYSTPSDVVYTLGKDTPTHYRNTESKVITVGPTVLFVYAQINRFNLLDISYDRSVVRSLMSKGLDVYVLDWGYSGTQDDSRSVDDYVKILHTVLNIINSKDKK
jgi:poly[(R)-3-hydroxyalkanoate] polymerase subunit PhaC